MESLASEALQRLITFVVKLELWADRSIPLASKPLESTFTFHLMSFTPNVFCHGGKCNTHGFPIMMHVHMYGFRHDSYESIHE
jgi:hypothetical protein